MDGAVMWTASGRQVDLLRPDPSAICVEDIAHSLSHLCRFAGSCRRFYSVAEHSVHCADVAESLAPPSWSVAARRELALLALLHDAAEAYTGDIPRPVKAALKSAGSDAVSVIEDRLNAAVSEAFGLPWPIPERSAIRVAAIDGLLLEIEMAVLMPGWYSDRRCMVRLECLEPAAAREKFQNKFKNLWHSS